MESIDAFAIYRLYPSSRRLSSCTYIICTYWLQCVRFPSRSKKKKNVGDIHPLISFFFFFIVTFIVTFIHIRRVLFYTNDIEVQQYSVYETNIFIFAVEQLNHIFLLNCITALFMYILYTRLYIIVKRLNTLYLKTNLNVIM